MIKSAALALLLAQAPGLAASEPPAAQANAARVIRAQYAWGYAGMDGEGSGTLSALVDPATGKVILELHGVGERLMLLTGDRATGYHVQIPREDLDRQVSSFGELPLPFLPQLGSAEALYKLLTEGAGPGVKVRKRDPKGPVKLRYSGKDENGKDVDVWLSRSRWETD
jgi:hypothetical protein